jgi:hypothetical protein
LIGSAGASGLIGSLVGCGFDWWDVTLSFFDDPRSINETAISETAPMPTAASTRLAFNQRPIWRDWTGTRFGFDTPIPARTGNTGASGALISFLTGTGTGAFAAWAGAGRTGAALFGRSKLLSASAASFAVWYLSSGSVAIILSIAWTSRGGSPGLTSLIGIAWPVIRPTMQSIDDSPLKGSCPVIRWYIEQPSE